MVAAEVMAVVQAEAGVKVVEVEAGVVEVGLGRTSPHSAFS